MKLPLALLNIAALTAACASAAVPVVNTNYGPVAGIATPTGYAYLGIPFAAPPQRWGAPFPPLPWSTPLNASTDRAGCIQFSPHKKGGVGFTDSEDCLTVNVFVPARQATGNPLIVWIHGGGFIGGSGSGDFSSYANGTGAIIVSVNYRLGSLGYLALPGMAPAFPTPTDPSAACANVGLLDQQMALLWAKANAAAFGANASNILLTGQSAGGSSVLFQLTLNVSYGTYRAAIPISPGSPTNTLASGQATATAIANKLNCSATDGFAAQLACLRALPSNQVVNAAVAVAGTGFLPLTLGPVIDGALVKASPVDAILAGDFNANAFIVVTETLFEGDSLLAGYTGTTVLTPQKAAQAVTEFGVMVGWNASQAAAVGSWYDAITAADGYFNGTSRMWGDGLISCAAAWTSIGAATHSKQPVHRLLWNATYPGQTAHRATHGSDLPFYFNAPQTMSSGEVAVQEGLFTWLINLAVTGDVNSGPRGAGPIEWPVYAAPGGPVLVIATDHAAQHQYSFVTAWQEGFCNQWLPLLP